MKKLAIFTYFQNLSKGRVWIVDCGLRTVESADWVLFCGPGHPDPYIRGGGGGGRSPFGSQFGPKISVGVGGQAPPLDLSL